MARKWMPSRFRLPSEPFLPTLEAPLVCSIRPWSYKNRNFLHRPTITWPFVLGCNEEFGTNKTTFNATILHKAYLETS